MQFYTGIGSRKTPTDICKFMTKIAFYLKENYTLRSGGAKGADTAFELGAVSNKEIYRPNLSNKEVEEFALSFHPLKEKVNTFKPYVRALHGRNAYQIVGLNYKDPVLSKFVLCWTPDGCESHTTRTMDTGGTGTAISIAHYYKVPILNLKNIEILSIDFILNWINSICL